MNRKWKTAVLFFFLFVATACVPTEMESGLADINETATPLPLPMVVPQVGEPDNTAVSPTPISISLPLHPDEVPATLPVYVMALDSIAATGEEALAWAQSFGLTQADVMEATNEMVLVLSRDEAAGIYEELTFLRTSYEEVIVYSSGLDWQNISGPTPTPAMETPPLLPPEMVTNIALAFVRGHELLPEPLIAHEFPGYDEYYQVQVTTGLSGLRLTGIGEEAGVRVRIDGNGRVAEARIIPANFTVAETVAVQPLHQIYSAFVQGTMQNVYFNERAQAESGDVRDFMRFQAHSLLYGDQGDRAELVYTSLPLQPERLVPMWLITRPDKEAWDHYVEYYLLATEENVPRPTPSPSPQAQIEVEPEAMRIVPPLIVDGGDGRLYTNAVVNGITRTVSLDAVTGGVLALFDVTGDLALDASRHLFYVDNYPHGLTVIDTATGETRNDMQLPPGERSHARPQADPATGQILLFRDQMLLVADPLAETWQQTIPFMVAGTVCDEPMEKPPTIQQSWFDEEARLLYLSFVDYVCTPWISYMVIVYDLARMSEVARYPGVDYLSGAAVNGRFYAKSRFRLGKTFQWAWLNGQPWLAQMDRGDDFVGGFSGFQVDEGRSRLYEMTVGGLQVLDMETMAVVQSVPTPLEGQLVGFDPVTDNLYFVGEADSRLHIWPVSELLP
jgi:hypothetical protein